MVAVDVHRGVEGALAHDNLEGQVGSVIFQRFIRSRHDVVALACVADVAQCVFQMLHGIGKAGAYLAVCGIARLTHLLHHLEVYV